MAKTLQELLSPTYVGAYADEALSNRIPYLGEALFPVKKQVGLTLDWIKGSKGLPVVLRPAAFDTKAQIRDRQGLSDMSTKMPFFKDSHIVDENLRQQLLLYLQANNPAFKTLVTRIYDDTAELIEAALAQLERMRMQVITTGKIGISTPEANYDYDFLHSDNLKEVLAGTAKWDAADTANPFEDIARWKTAVADESGETITRAVLNSTTAAKIARSVIVRKAMNPVGYANEYITSKKVLAFLSEEFDIQFVVYDKKFIDEAGVTKSYIPDGIISFLPAGTIGNTWFGTTPEEANKAALAKTADVAIVQTGIAITSAVSFDPVVAQTKASMVAMPSGESIDSVFIATVF